MNQAQQNVLDAQTKLFSLEDQLVAAQADVVTANAEWTASLTFANRTLPTQQAQDRAAASQIVSDKTAALNLKIAAAQSVSDQTSAAQLALDNAVLASRQNNKQEQV